MCPTKVTLKRTSFQHIINRSFDKVWCSRVWWKVYSCYMLLLWFIEIVVMYLFEFPAPFFFPAPKKKVLLRKGKKKGMQETPGTYILRRWQRGCRRSESCDMLRDALLGIAEVQKLWPTSCLSWPSEWWRCSWYAKTLGFGHRPTMALRTWTRRSRSKKGLHRCFRQQIDGFKGQPFL